MPRNDEILTHCIKCGKPSSTVVCMSCFFQYEHRSYEPEEHVSIPEICVRRAEYRSENPAPYQSEFSPDLLISIGPDIQDENLMTVWDEDDCILEQEESSKESTPESLKETLNETLKESIKESINDAPLPRKPKSGSGSSVSWFSRLPRF